MSKAKRGNYHFLKPASPVKVFVRNKGIYNLTVRQHPIHSRVWNVTEKNNDQKTLDPATIVELNISDEDETSSTDSSHFHYNPFLFAYASLVDAITKQELYFLPDENTRILTGSIASCVYHLKDPENNNTFRAFFVFPDIAVRKEGSFCLKITIFKIYSGTEDPTSDISKVVQKNSVFTKAFTVSQNRAMGSQAPSSILSKSFAEQGLKLRLRKVAKPASSKRDSSESSASDSGDDSESSKPKTSGPVVSAPSKSRRSNSYVEKPQQVEYHPNPSPAYPPYPPRVPPPNVDYHPYAYPPHMQSHHRGYSPYGLPQGIPPPHGSANPYWNPYYPHYPPPSQAYQARPQTTSEFSGYPPHSNYAPTMPRTLSSTHSLHSSGSLPNSAIPADYKLMNMPPQVPPQQRYPPAAGYYPTQSRRSEHELRSMQSMQPVQQPSLSKTDALSSGNKSAGNSTSNEVDDDREGASWDVGSSTKKPRVQSPRSDYESPIDPPRSFQPDRRPSSTGKPNEMHYPPYGYPQYPPQGPGLGYPGYYHPPHLGNYAPRPLPPASGHPPYPYQSMPNPYYPEPARYAPSAGYPMRPMAPRPRSPVVNAVVDDGTPALDVWPSPK